LVEFLQGEVLNPYGNKIMTRAKHETSSLTPALKPVNQATNQGVLAMPLVSVKTKPV